MTRTEKYKKYREEIKHSFFDDKERTTKEKSSELVEQILESENRETSSLTFDEVMEAHTLYEKDEVKPVKKRMTLQQKKKLTFIVVSAVVISLLIVGVILVGINLFGGK